MRENLFYGYHGKRRTAEEGAAGSPFKDKRVLVMGMARSGIAAAQLLCREGALRELPGFARAFRVKYNQAHGILEATAVTAVPMSADQTARLHEKLEAVTGKTIDLRTKVDAAVLGGIRLDIEGTELDGTVKNRLASLRRSIAGITV